MQVHQSIQKRTKSIRRTKRYCNRKDIVITNTGKRGAVVIFDVKTTLKNLKDN